MPISVNKMMNHEQFVIHDYQIAGVNFIKQHKKCALWFTMGTGKTLTTLVALGQINEPVHMLVVAPRAIARATWVDEIEQWHIPLPHTSLIVNESGKTLTRAKRHEVYETVKTSSPQMWFINRENLVDLVEYFDNGKSWPFATVILDEAQGFKSWASKRFRAIRKCLPRINRLIELTGTPSPNGLMDLWTQIYLLDGGMRLGTTLTQFRETFFIPGRIINGHVVEWTPRPGAKEAIEARIKDIVLSADNSGLKLPAFTVNDIKVHMDPDAQNKYNELKRTSVLKGLVPEGSDKITDVTAENSAVLAGRLRQMASGSLYLTDDDGNNIGVADIHSEKLEVTQYIIDNTDSPVLVFYEFRHDLDRLLSTIKDASGHAGVKFDGSPEMVHAWNEDKIPIMFLQPQSAGHGLNLQKGSGHTIVWYTLPWSLELYEQANARIYRQGQKKPVVCHRILTSGTIDTRVAKALSDKHFDQKEIMDSVKVEW